MAMLKASMTPILHHTNVPGEVIVPAWSLHGCRCFYKSNIRKWDDSECLSLV